MIIDRITAIRAIPPRIVTTREPIRRPLEIETAYVVGAGERQIAEGTTGTILDVSYDELEIEVYAPSDLILTAQQSLLRPA